MQPMTNCHISGCRRLNTVCADCGRLVIDRVLPENDKRIAHLEKELDKLTNVVNSMSDYLYNL